MRVRRPTKGRRSFRCCQTRFALDTLRTRVGLDSTQMSLRLVMVAADGAAVRQGQATGPVQRVRKSCGPFVQPMQCMSHRVDLCASVLDKHTIM